MGIAELVQDVRKAKNCGGGEVPEETMGDMVCKIAHRLMQNVRPATFSPDRMAARRKEVERHWKAAIRVAVTATYLQRRSTTQVPAGTTLAVQESVRRDPQQDKSTCNTSDTPLQHLILCESLAHGRLSAAARGRREARQECYPQDCCVDQTVKHAGSRPVPQN